MKLRDCENCIHYVESGNGYKACESWNCEFESSKENSLVKNPCPHATE